MEFQAFLTSLGTSFLIFLVLMLLHTWFSRKPSNTVVYYPNKVINGLESLDPIEAAKRTRNPVSWIREALSSTEPDVVNNSGVDSAVYFVFLTTVLGILVFSGVVLLPVLLPVAATDRSPRVFNPNDTTSQGSFNDLDKLSMSHVGDNNPRLWPFLAATYWVSFLTYFFLWKAYKHVSILRATALRNPDIRPEQYALIVRDIPKPPEGQSRKEQVDSFFQSIYPDYFYRSMIVTDNKKVNKIFKELEGFRKKLARAETIHANKPGVPKPSHKTGLCGLFGKKVDSIEYYREKINETLPKLEAEQKLTLREKQQSSALVFFTNRVVAASASQSLHAQKVDRWTVIEATEPRQILWSNLKKKFYARIIRQYLVYFIVFLTIFFYMIPIGLISAFTTLENLKKLLPFTKIIVDQPAIRTVLEAYLPQIVLIIFLALLPKLLVFLSKAEGIPTLAHVHRAASGKYFYFIVLNVFIGVTLGSTLFDTLKHLEKKPDSIFNMLATSLPKSATFFLTYVALRTFVGYGLELSRLVPLIIFHLKKKFLCKTEDEVKNAWHPKDLNYAKRFPGDMLVVTIVLCYSVMAPVIIPFGVLYFGLGWLVLRNQVLNVYVPSYESYGRMWPHIFTRIVAALLLYQVTMVAYIGVKRFPYASILIPLPILSLVFSYVCTKKFYRFFQSTPLEVVNNDLKERPNMELIFRSFIPASLISDKSRDDHDDAQFIDALAMISGPANIDNIV